MQSKLILLAISIKLYFLIFLFLLLTAQYTDVHVYIIIPAKKKSLTPLITSTSVDTSVAPKLFTPMWYRAVAMTVIISETMMPSFFIVDSSIVSGVVSVVTISYELTSLSEDFGISLIYVLYYFHCIFSRF